MPVCMHLDQVSVTKLPESVDGCQDCLATGGKWLHLRMCLSCGHVGCCDSSPNRHASAHHASTSHAVMRSLEAGERWCWCFEERKAFILPSLSGSTRLPPSPLLAESR